MRRLGLVVTTPPERGDFERAERLAAAARSAGVEVTLFLMSDAAGWAASPRATALCDQGCEVIACSTNLDRLGIEAVADGVVVGSQDDHARLVHDSDRVVAFA